MKLYLLMSCVVLLPALAAGTAQTMPKIRPPFIKSAEAVIDATDRIELWSSDEVYQVKWDHAKDLDDELSRSASNEAERELAKSVTAFLDQIGICRVFRSIPDPKDFRTCSDDLDAYRMRPLTLMRMHKEVGVWMPGAPKLDRK